MKKTIEHDKSLKNDRGNIIIAGIIMLSFLTLYGAAMMSRMIVDSHASANRITTTKAYYIAEAGIKWGRKYLVSNTAETSLGPINFGGGTLNVVITRETIKLNAWNNNQQIYRITSSSTLGQAGRTIEEFRYRGGGSDKQLIFYREKIDGDL